MEGVIIALVGRRGSGKTCLMTHLGYQDFLNDRPIVSNYHLEFKARYMTLSQVADLPAWMRNITLLTDEVQVAADSREIFKPGNKALTTLATQLRKRKINWLYTTQRIGQVDKRLRQQTDIIIEVQNVTDKDGWFKMTIWDMRSPGDPTTKYFYGVPTYDLYDTDEVITFEGEEVDDE